ncbi:MAG: hypothetical protein GF353_02690 [Candidatus Lokiarchaeota archaeon]|nr:hypothetical protein [Candidatus Lokiarchaeota archaeon]
MENRINFKNKSRNKRYKKELIIFFLIGIILASAIFYYYFIKYSPVYSLDYPQVNLTFEDEEVNYDDFIDCSFQLKSKVASENVDSIDGSIKIRGSGTGWNRIVPKKGYRVELSKSVSLLGMREDDDWLLMGIYSDYPRMRIKMSMELWNTLNPTNPTAILPESEYVNVFINGEYEGLFLLCERNDRRLYGLDEPQNSLDSSLIFQARGPIFLRNYEPIRWEQDWPNEYEGISIMDEILSQMIKFIANSSDEEFFNTNHGIYSKFNKLNLIDFYIYNFFILHKDFWNCNYFIVRNTNPSNYFLVPWDFDKSFGQFAWHMYDSDDNQENVIREDNELFNRLIGNSEFMADCKERWFELRNSIWTEEKVLDMVYEIYNEIIDILPIETEKWNPSKLSQEWENDLDHYVNFFIEWIPERLDFCDSYFDDF